jgi:hypothetical protein
VSERGPGVWQVYGPHGLLPERYATVAEARAMAMAGKREWQESRRAFNEEDKRLQDEAAAEFATREAAADARRGTYQPPPSPVPPRSSPAPPPPPPSPRGWKSGTSAWGTPYTGPGATPPPSPPTPGQPPDRPWQTSAFSYHGQTPPAWATAPPPPAPPGPTPQFPSGVNYYPQSAPPKPHAFIGPAGPDAAQYFGKHFDDLKDVLQKSIPRGGFNWQAIGQTMGRAFVSAGSAPASVGVPAAIGAAARVGGAAMGAAAGPAGLALASIVLVNEQLARFAERITESNKRLIPFSGSISAAYINLSMGDFHRQFALAHATAPTASRLAGTTNAARDAWFPVEQFQANISNRFAIAGAENSKVIGGAIALPSMVMNSMMERLDKDGSAAAAVGRAAGYMQLAGIGGLIGGLATGFNPIGVVVGAAAGLAVGAAGEFMKYPVRPFDPWKDFLNRAGTMPSLPARPGRTVRF